MKYTFTLLAAFFGIVAHSSATVLVTGFDNYSNGSLVGATDPQGQTWSQIGGAANNPLTITDGVLAIGASGQRGAISLGSSFTTADLYYAFTLNVSVAQTGDILATFSANNTATGGGGRLFVQSSGTGLFVLGGAVATSVTYGTTALSLNTDYRIVFHYSITPGSGNDSFKIYVDPINTTNEGANTPYLSSTLASGLGNVDYFQILQNSSGSSPTSTMSNLVVATTFAEAAPVPEPGSVLLVVMAGIFFIITRFRVAKSN